MGELTKEKLDMYSVGDTFIETGTQFGGTIKRALDYGFKTIHTVELNPDYVQVARDSFGHVEGVHIYEGDSPDFLRELCPTLDKPCTFWLDGHKTGGPSGESEKYGWGPVLAELHAIATSPCKEHVLYLDDVRDFGSYGWPLKEQIIQAIMDINPNYKIHYVDGHHDRFPNDILVATVFN